MKWIAAQVTVGGPDIDLAIDLVADIFYSLDLKGVVVDDPKVDPTQDWGADALPPPEMPAVTGYFADTADAAMRCRKLESRLKQLQDRTDIESGVTYTRIDEADWAEAWKEYFWPEKITDRIVVKPTWRDYQPAGDEKVLEIDPGMAFGTGTHPTTALCIQLTEKHLQPGERLLDVGTGSGILMVAAWLLGAAAVHGIDNDPVAVAVARQNLATNRVPAEVSRVWTGDRVASVTTRYEFVVANILAEVIIGLLPDIPGLLAPGGRFICSGILHSQQEDVTAEARKVGLDLVEALEREEWVALVYK